MNIPSQWKIFYLVSLLVAMGFGAALMVVFGQGNGPVTPQAKPIVIAPTLTPLPIVTPVSTPTCAAWTARENTCILKPKTSTDFRSMYKDPTRVAHNVTRTAIAQICGIKETQSSQMTATPILTECVAYRATVQALLTTTRTPVDPNPHRYRCNSGRWWFRLLCAGSTYVNDK